MSTMPAPLRMTEVSGAEALWLLEGSSLGRVFVQRELTVTLSGPAEVITDPDEAAFLHCPKDGWTHGPHDTVLRPHPKTVTGFAVRAEA